MKFQYELFKRTDETDEAKNKSQVEIPTIKLNCEKETDKPNSATTMSNASSSRTSLGHFFNLNYNGQSHTNVAAKTNGSTGFRPSHSRTRSDQTGIFNGNIHKTASVTNLKATIGDLMSGRAFDNNCNCYEQQLVNSQQSQANNNVANHVNEANNELNGIDEENKENEENVTTRQEADKDRVNFECVCSAPRLAPELEFTKCLISIGKKLIRINTKELKSNKHLHK